jgi:hypothetical protein
MTVPAGHPGRFPSSRASPFFAVGGQYNGASFLGAGFGL